MQNYVHHALYLLRKVLPNVRVFTGKDPLLEYSEPAILVTRSKDGDWLYYYYYTDELTDPLRYNAGFEEPSSGKIAHIELVILSM